MEFPEELRYTREHEWVRAEGEGGERVRVGITDFAVGALAGVVFVDLAEVGARVVAHVPLGVV
ncbi:MAG: glycine cleavage system protein H, partial [Actinomycetota bacterium]